MKVKVSNSLIDAIKNRIFIIINSKKSTPVVHVEIPLCEEASNVSEGSEHVSECTCRLDYEDYACNIDGMYYYGLFHNAKLKGDDINELYRREEAMILSSSLCENCKNGELVQLKKEFEYTVKGGYEENQKLYAYVQENKYDLLLGVMKPEPYSDGSYYEFRGACPCFKRWKHLSEYELGKLKVNRSTKRFIRPIQKYYQLVCVSSDIVEEIVKTARGNNIKVRHWFEEEVTGSGCVDEIHFLSKDNTLNVRGIFKNIDDRINSIEY